MKKTILHEWHKEHGGDMVEFSGWEMPMMYLTCKVQFIINLILKPPWKAHDNYL